jgi:hypothetical protein
MPGEQMVNRLQRLIDDHQVEEIHIYRFSDSKLHQKSEEWSFGHEFVQVGGQPYNLNRVVTFLVVDQVLELYF